MTSAYFVRVSREPSKEYHPLRFFIFSESLTIGRIVTLENELGKYEVMDVNIHAGTVDLREVV